MTKKQEHGKLFVSSILSLSLLTVMAGAAVAPALGVIQAYFSDCDPLFVQMIISMPAIFIVLTNFIFPKLCRRLGSKTLVMIGLLFYTLGGCLAGAFDHIAVVLLMRALVGIGVGIIMPLSTGLLVFYYPPWRLSALMGYSSAMNQLGGVIATLLSGLLAGISWRASFLVYLLGLVSIVLCLFFLPNDIIQNNEDVGADEGIGTTFKKYYPYIIGMFLLMTIFFIYPANFAMEVVKEGVIDQKYIAIIMAMMDLIAFFGGLLFVVMQKLLRSQTKFLAPILFLLGFLLLAWVGGWAGTLIGSVLIGFANGVGIPFIISTASARAGRSAVTTVMPLMSAALYLAQFLSPVLMSGCTLFFGQVNRLPFLAAALLSAVFVLWSILIPSQESKA